MIGGKIYLRGCVVAWFAAQLVGCSVEVGDAERVGSVGQALSCETGGVCTATTPDGNVGTWPNGVVRYHLEGSTAFQNMVRAAMDDWQNVTNHVISFQDSYVLPYASIVEGEGKTMGYGQCSRYQLYGCPASMNRSNVYHELGHLLGLKHEAQRFDRDHYEIVHDKIHQSGGVDGLVPYDCTDKYNVARTSSSGALGGQLGPFDYQSTMQYAPTHPDLTRFDGTPIAPNAACGEGGDYLLPPQCLNSSCSSCDWNVGVCPTCLKTATRQRCELTYPMGFPTKGDGAAVVEMYRNVFDPRWDWWRRGVNEDTGAGAHLPYDYRFPGTVSSIGTTRSLSASAYPNGNFDIHVTGPNSHVWEKSKVGSSFTNWTDLGALPGTGFVSDPAEVSWGAGRLDVVVRQGSTIYHKTWVSGVGWTTWQSLGTPASTPQSAPAIASWGPDRLDVFVRGADKQLYWMKCTANCKGNQGTWSAWSPVPGGTFLGKPSAVASAVGVINVMVHGEDHRLWSTQWANDNWSGFALVDSSGTLKWDPSCPDCCSPAVMSRGVGKLDVVIRGGDDQAWIISVAWPGGWSGFHPIGGVLASSPTGIARARSTDRIDLFAVMAEETDYGYYERGPWWKQYTE